MCLDIRTTSALTRATVVSNDPVAEGMFRLRLDVALWRGSAPEAGQFVMLRAGDGDDPLLGRPFGVAAFEPDGEGAALELLYRVVGRGTGRMSLWGVGQAVSFLGPLGRGFPLHAEGSRSLLVAGGIGLPPLLFLARKLGASGSGGAVTLVYGEASRKRMMDVDSLELAGVDVVLCTEDGSLGVRGRVTDVLGSLDSLSDSHLYACGPAAMLRSVHAMAQGRCPAHWYSLESRMACGFGVCMGCAVKVRQGGEDVYVRVCTEGPVFAGDDLVESSFPERV